MTGRDRRSTRTGRGDRKVSQHKRRQKGPVLVSIGDDCSPEEFMRCLCCANGVVRSDLTAARSLRNFFEIMKEGKGRRNLVLAQKAFQRVEADLKEILGHEEDKIRSAVETIFSLAEKQIPPPKLAILRQAAGITELPF